MVDDEASWWAVGEESAVCWLIDVVRIGRSES